MFLNCWLAIIFMWLLAFPLSIYLVSEKIALLGVYHHLDRTNWRKVFSIHNSDDEYFPQKAYKVFLANLYLSIPFVITYYIVIKSTLDPETEIQPIEITFLSYILTLISLLTVRVLSNPPIFLSSKVCLLYPVESRGKIQASMNERIISFFHSFICATLILLGILFSANITLNSKVLPQAPEIHYLELFEIVFIYVMCIVFLTLLSELILFAFPPKNQIAYGDIKAKDAGITTPDNQ